MKLPTELDEDLVELLRASGRPTIPDRVRRDPTRVLRRAELHGVAGVVQRLLADAGIALDPALRAELGMREAARELDHAAHLRTITNIDAAFAEANVAGVALKGCLLAERYYAVPSSRATSDIDLMVRESDLESAARALAPLGYTQDVGAEEARFRREHHHLHFHSASGPPLELHFHAYRGFGSVLWSEPLIARRERHATVLKHGAVGVLSRPDELLYLAVHAGAHRFIRLGWLYDLRLVIEQMSAAEIELAAARAREAGYARLLAFTAALLEDVFRIPLERLAPLGRLSPIRARIVRRVVGEPASSLERSATRFVYSAALCDTLPSAARYAMGASVGRARLLFPS